MQVLCIVLLLNLRIAPVQKTSDIKKPAAEDYWEENIFFGIKKPKALDFKRTSG